MNISNCPRCNDVIRVPENDPSHDSQAQCPWCGETYPLAEVIDRLPPMLTILGADGTAISQAPQDTVAIQSVAAPSRLGSAETQHRLDGFVLADGQPAINETVAFDREIGGDLTGNSVSAAPKVQATPRRRKSGGGLRRMLGVVFGGLLAVPIAGFILWYFELGPFEGSSRGGQNRVASAPLELRQDRSPMANGQAPAVNASAGPVELGQPGLELSESDPPLTKDLTTENPVQVEPAADDSPGSVAPSEDALTDNFQAVQPSPPEAENDSLDDLVSASESKELVDTIDRAKQMITALETYDVDKQKRVQWLVTAYQTIAKAGELAESQGPAIQDLARTIKGSKILDELNKAGADWMNFDTRGNNGALIIGEYDGKSLALESGKNVNVSGTTSGSATGRVIVLGTIVDSETVDAIVIEPLP